MKDVVGDGSRDDETSTGTCRLKSSQFGAEEGTRRSEEEEEGGRKEVLSSPGNLFVLTLISPMPCSV